MSKSNGADTSFSLDGQNVTASSETPPLYKPTKRNTSSARSRMSFPLKDGKPDVERMNADQLAEFRKVYSDPDLRKALGFETPKQAEKVPQFTEAAVRQLYDVLGPIQAYAMALLLKCPIQLAAKVFTYTEAEKKLLIPPTQEVMEKYAEYLDVYAKYHSEIALVWTFGIITNNKIATLKMLIKNPPPDEPVTPPAPASQTIDAELPSVANTFENTSSISTPDAGQSGN